MDKYLTRDQYRTITELYAAYTEADEDTIQSALYALSNFVFTLTGISYAEPDLIAFCERLA